MVATLKRKLAVGDSAMTDDVTEPEIICCSLCSKPVALESAKADDHGKIVHEQCYVRIAAGKSASTTEKLSSR
jgi:hypothetical protein